MHSQQLGQSLRRHASKSGGLLPSVSLSAASRGRSGGGASSGPFQPVAPSARCFGGNDRHERPGSKSNSGRDPRFDALDSWEFGSHDDLSWTPAPSNTPTNEDVAPHPESSEPPLFAPWTMRKLTSLPGIDLMAPGAPSVAHLKKVYVILFGVGSADAEGIYSLRDYSMDGLPQETIIMFECEEDATRYAALLEATMQHTPTVASLPAPELLDFCVEAGYRCCLEPAGSLLMPPDFNVGVTDWERSRSLRDGKWSVLSNEPETTTQPSGPGTAAQAKGGQVATLPAAQPTGPSNAYSALWSRPMSKEELAQARDRLEALLPPSLPGDEQQ